MGAILVVKVIKKKFIIKIKRNDLHYIVSAVVCGEQDFEVCPSDGKSPWHAQRGGTQCMERSQSGKGFPRDIVHSGGYRRSTFKLFSDLAGS